jgi:hypothetical protein
LIGLMIVLMLWMTNQPFGALGGYIEGVHRLTRKRPDLTWRLPPSPLLLRFQFCFVLLPQLAASAG